MEGFPKLAIGAVGLVSSEAASHIPFPTDGTASEIISILVQIVIGVATLIGLFKKKTPKP